MPWTRKSYRSLYDWPDIGRRDSVREALRVDKLDDVIERLDNARNLGVWYHISCEAAAAVGSKIVAAEAGQAKIELEKIIAANNGRQGGSSKSAAKQAASRANGKLGGRPPKKKKVTK